MSTTLSNNSVRQVNVAVVGLGAMGMRHLEAYRQIKCARIAAVCSTSGLPVSREFSSARGNPAASDRVLLDPAVKAHRDFNELLADPAIKLIDICVPAPLHHVQALAALQAGKHVICEKPLARISGWKESSLRLRAGMDAAPGLTLSTKETTD